MPCVFMNVLIYTISQASWQFITKRLLILDTSLRLTDGFRGTLCHSTKRMSGIQAGTRGCFDFILLPIWLLCLCYPPPIEISCLLFSYCHHVCTSLLSSNGFLSTAYWMSMTTFCIDSSPPTHTLWFLICLLSDLSLRGWHLSLASKPSVVYLWNPVCAEHSSPLARLLSDVKFSTAEADKAFHQDRGISACFAYPLLVEFSCLYRRSSIPCFMYAI